MTDQELIAEILRGSRSSQEVLVRRHYKLVYSFIYRMTGEKEIALDLTQEVFIKILNNLGKYKGSGEFKSWCLTIASNHAKDYFKSKAHQNSRHTYELHEHDAKTDKSVSSIFEKNEKRKEIKEALDILPDFQREAILLKYYNDMKISEIARVTNATESTVKSRLKQGLGKLKLYLDRSEMDERHTNGS
ncbi:RNA polymerase sigma factor [Mesobacillus subterraneus]|uniref:RNA polymerase sigma factor n=1 Tax=Mesobacillus subterraneus TaxID=285983 RepID=A0A427TRF4_9BACI|nr:RNA polymerase sigma factor [Mesobacillus subterraneus]RSD26831.1 RNA polymerase sigma factor [Mesobacillus subterraneus]